MRILPLPALLALLLPGPPASAQDAAPGEAPQARIWLDRGDAPLLQQGERVRIYYRTSHDAYVAIFQIDTDGTVRLLHPRAPGDETFTRGGRDYRLLFPQSSYWFVDEYPGKGYFFVVASPEPFDLTAFDYVQQRRSWDLTRVGQAVYQDPYLAMDDYVARLIPNWETVPYALDFISYDVGETHDYPRFLCYDCHGFRSYTSWNPYTYACSTFRVVVWNDPYFYPAYRYRGSRVVYSQPRRGVAMFEFKERAAGETWTPLVRTRQPPLRRSADYVEPSAARSPVREWVPPRRPNTASSPPSAATPRRPSSGAASAGGAVPRRTSPTAGALSRTRRPSGSLSTPATARPRRTTTAPTTGRVTPSRTPTRRATPSQPQATSPRPTLQRRPTTSGARSSGRATVRPPTGSRPSATRPATRSRPPVSRPSSGSRTRVVRPPRSGGASARPARPPTRSPPVRASSRPPVKRSAKPPPKRRGGGG